MNYHYDQLNSDSSLEAAPEGFVFIEGPRPDWHKRVGQTATYFEQVQSRHPDAVLVRSDRAAGYSDAYASQIELPTTERQGWLQRVRAKLGGQATRY